MSSSNKRNNPSSDEGNLNKKHKANDHDTTVEAPSHFADQQPLPVAGENSFAGNSAAPSPFDPVNFEYYLCRLLLYKIDHGKFSPNVNQPHLCDFLKFLRKEFKNKSQGTGPVSLTEDHFKLLDHLNVPVTSRGDDHWNRFFDLLKEYKETHGHTLVPRPCEIAGLGDWVSDQRRQYKMWKAGNTTQLTAERRQKLEDLGFVWQVRDRPAWDVRYTELLEYREKYGHCKVPQHFKENKSLGKWVAKQREQYKRHLKGEHTFLTPLRLEKLNTIGFVWSMRTSLDDPKSSRGSFGSKSEQDEETKSESAEAQPTETEAQHIDI